jgi:hypothetical protein
VTTAARARTVTAGGQAHPDAVAVGQHRGDPAVVADDGAVGGGRLLQRGHRGVGVHPGGGVRLVQHRAGEPQAGPSLGRLRGRKPLVLDAGPLHRRRHLTPPRLAGRSRGGDSRTRVQHAPAGLVLEFGPQLASLGDQRLVVRFGIGAAVDAGPAVGGAQVVSGTELLEQDDADAATGQRPGGRRAHDAAADHDDVGAARGAHEDHDPTGGLTTGASTASSTRPQRRSVCW